MMDRGADWNSVKDGALKIMSHNGMLTLVIFYPDKLYYSVLYFMLVH
jgi:hypothetical protein